MKKENNYSYKNVLQELLENTSSKKMEGKSLPCRFPTMLKEEICSNTQTSKLKSLPQSELFTAVTERNWQRALLCVRSNPDMCRYQSKHGYYPLHAACYIGSCPYEVSFNILEAFPEAVNLRNCYPVGDTPLHTLAKNCQGTSSKSKMKALLHYANVRLRDQNGNTVLHLACQFNARIAVLQDLISKDLPLLDIQNNDGETPMEYLWRFYLKCIPGHLAVACILSKKTHEPPEHLRKFWEKVKLFILRERYGHDDSLLGHLILQYNLPQKMLQVSVKMDPSLAFHHDNDGNYLIHKMLLQKLSFDQSVLETVYNRKAFIAQNFSGDTVLSLALKMKMFDYIEFLIEVAPELLVSRDITTKLYPFQLASTSGCPTKIVFRLLILRPEVMNYCDR
mmetsp:Transcript_33663/g.37216  ORF Transcript_33663/g.37216 Transcript_33663/m.37216 type:complete len:393 (-) Transcript_33663:89-1267(-)